MSSSTVPQKMGKATSSMMVPLGTRLQSPSIRRVDVADQTLARGIILSEQAMAVLLHYNEAPKESKGYYLVSEEDVLKYGLSANLYYVILIARLNTDARGNIMDDTLRIEYLRLKESSYNDLMDDIEEVGTRSLAMKKVTQGEFSHVECKPSLKMENDPMMINAKEKSKTLNIEALYKLTVRELGKDFKANKDRLGIKEIEDNFESTASEAPKKLRKATPAFEEAGEFAQFEEVTSAQTAPAPKTKAPARDESTENPHDLRKAPTPAPAKVEVEVDEFDMGEDFPDMK